MNCKPGDLAYLSSDCVDEGVIVEVIKLASDAERRSDLPAWHCRSRTPLRCEGGRAGKFKLSSNVVIEDRYLRPISGVPITDEIADEVTS